ncbi:MAG: hypothetical protein JKX76_01195 [Colwellia sp.]|nr:hypothetical protein [Colwellia sp.]
MTSTTSCNLHNTEFQFVSKNIPTEFDEAVILQQLKESLIEKFEGMYADRCLPRLGEYILTIENVNNLKKLFPQCPAEIKKTIKRIFHQMKIKYGTELQSNPLRCGWYINTTRLNILMDYFSTFIYRKQLFDTLSLEDLLYYSDSRARTLVLRSKKYKSYTFNLAEMYIQEKIRFSHNLTVNVMNAAKDVNRDDILKLGEQYNIFPLSDEITGILNEFKIFLCKEHTPEPNKLYQMFNVVRSEVIDEMMRTSDFDDEYEYEIPDYPDDDMINEECCSYIVENYEMFTET